MSKDYSVISIGRAIQAGARPTFSGSITIDPSLDVRCYGKVTRNGRIFLRNYKHPLKNGKGIAVSDLVKEKIDTYRRIFVEVMRDVYGEESLV